MSIKEKTEIILGKRFIKLIKNNKLFKKTFNLLEKRLVKPSWQIVEKGILKGHQIFINPKGGWAEMVTGDYDEFFFNFLSTQNLNGKVIYDIGAHIGYSSMAFAKLVGDSGKVFSFEPNIYNRERFELILSKNKDLSSIIKIFGVAISSSDGEADFIFNENVDNCKSSGSFIDESHTFFEKSRYEKDMGFSRVKVPTVSIDSLDLFGIKDKPDFIKIDIEGAEFLAIDGGKELLVKHHPVLLIEIHSIFNMFKVQEALIKLNYKITLLKEESDGRCFISASI